MQKEELIKMRLDGYTYKQIGDKYDVSRQRIQQIISPPKSTRDIIVEKFDGRCKDCGIYVGWGGDIHHNNLSYYEDYNDIGNLTLLCKSCHRGTHHCGDGYNEAKVNLKEESTMITEIRRKLDMTQGKFAERLGVSRITVNRWENLVQNPSKKNLKKIVDLEDMIEGYKIASEQFQDGIEQMLESSHQLKEWYPALGIISKKEAMKLIKPKRTIMYWVDKLINIIDNYFRNK